MRKHKVNQVSRLWLTIALVLGFGLTSIATSFSPVSAEEDDEDTRVIVLVDGRSPDPRTTTVNEELGVPPYADTGVGKTVTWTLEVPDGWTLIIGGVTVKIGDEAFDKGFIKVIEGPADAEKYRVTDGFYKYIETEGAWDEFCMRLQQHRDNGWLISAVEVPTDWDNCPGVTEAGDTSARTTDADEETGDPNTTTVNGRDRVDAVANGGSDVINGQKGDWTIAESIGIDGRVVCSGFCRVQNASKPFTAYGGVVNPTKAEWDKAVKDGFKKIDV